MTIQKIMKQNRRYLPWICGLSAVMIMGMPVMAESTPGVTVEADENSPTGYTATFVYENAEASEVKLLGTFSFYTRGYPIGAVPETFSVSATIAGFAGSSIFSSAPSTL